MGFFSWKCSKTQRSIPAYPHAGRPKKHSDIVLVLPDNSTIQGIYNGYGDIDDKDILVEVAQFVVGKGTTRDEIFRGGHIDKVMDAIKLVLRSEYKGETYDQLTVSKQCPKQGYFY